MFITRNLWNFYSRRIWLDIPIMSSDISLSSISIIYINIKSTGGGPRICEIISVLTAISQTRLTCLHPQLKRHIPERGNLITFPIFPELHPGRCRYTSKNISLVGGSFYSLFKKTSKQKQTSKLMTLKGETNTKASGKTKVFLSFFLSSQRSDEMGTLFVIMTIHMFLGDLEHILRIIIKIPFSDLQFLWNPSSMERVGHEEPKEITIGTILENISWFNAMLHRT